LHSAQRRAHHGKEQNMILILSEPSEILAIVGSQRQASGTSLTVGSTRTSMLRMAAG
jgi:hypothetical protein